MVIAGSRVSTTTMQDETRQGLSTLKKGKLNRFVWEVLGLKITVSLNSVEN